MPLEMSFKILMHVDAVLLWREAVEQRGENSFRSPQCESGPHSVALGGRLPSLGIGLRSSLLQNKTDKSCATCLTDCHGTMF